MFNFRYEYPINYRENEAVFIYLSDSSYEKNKLFYDYKIWFSMAALFFLGMVLVCLYPNMPLTSNGYQELFYPPRLSFVCVAIPVVWLILFILNKIS